ncbi:hypothetical protein HELRODRAFT_164470 [Helobdella robusta]|uniref:Cleavage/polyadenylation specificity factor A subunit N-terminal domain-containing protein n=1 Tax=Helobdella robusta TaxID=6412 RepID=T1EVG6_HELRO|nr:hypothetical protein HELRODRAFT_164470 [Helobdella robusta]ESN94605.1 hypothetical protein HELRODRAFT_164470 [Helobdella robusta]
MDNVSLVGRKEFLWQARYVKHTSECRGRILDAYFPSSSSSSTTASSSSSSSSSTSSSSSSSSFPFAYIANGSDSHLYKLDLHRRKYVKKISLVHPCRVSSVVFIGVAGKVVLMCAAEKKVKLRNHTDDEDEEEDGYVNGDDPRHLKSNCIMLDIMTDSSEVCAFRGGLYVSQDNKHVVSYDSDENYIDVFAQQIDGSLKYLHGKHLIQDKINEVLLLDRLAGPEMVALSSAEGSLLFVQLENLNFETIEAIGLGEEASAKTRRRRLIRDSKQESDYLAVDSSNMLTVIDVQRRTAHCQIIKRHTTNYIIAHVNY